MEGDLLDMMQFPVYFEYENGVVGRVYVIENDSIFCTNIKKGIISMFQVQTEAGERMEVLVLCLKEMKYLEVYKKTLKKNRASDIAWKCSEK